MNRASTFLTRSSGRQLLPKLREKHVRALPSDDASCGWLETLPDRPLVRRLRSREIVDCAVIGAGFTGLAIARRLAELRPDWRIALIDAQRVGSGASGRASGFLVEYIDLAAKMSLAGRHRYLRVARRGIAHLKELARLSPFDCQWDETGWIRAAEGGAAERALEHWPGWLEEEKMPYRWLDRDGMHAVTGSSFYRAGIRLPGAPLIHAGALVRGLGATLPPNVELYEESPVTALDSVRGGRRRLTTTEGSVQAERVFLATNGYTPALGFLGRRVFPLFTFGSLTRRLTEEECQNLGGERQWGLLGTDAMGSSVRRTQDQRLLIRNTVHYSRNLRVDDSLEPAVREAHRRAFIARFPNLQNVNFEYTWSGLMGTVHNGNFNFGKLANGLYATAGFTGAGIAMGTAAGTLLADLALGEDSSLLHDIQALPGPTAMPPDPFRHFGGRWMVSRMNARAGEFL